MNPQPTEPRLPQIDPVTFAALNTLDTFIARAPLTRQEHAEANKSLQHLVQTLEFLQATIRQTSQSPVPAPARGLDADTAKAPDPATHNGGRVVAEVAEEVFRKAK
jgi:hypothetical protein